MVIYDLNGPKQHHRCFENSRHKIPYQNLIFMHFEDIGYFSLFGCNNIHSSTKYNIR